MTFVPTALEKVADDLVRDQAAENLQAAVEHRSDLVAQEEHAKDLIAHHGAELVKAERLLERSQTARPSADDAVREAFDFYRYAMERNQ